MSCPKCKKFDYIPLERGRITVRFVKIYYYCVNCRIVFENSYEMSLKTNRILSEVEMKKVLENSVIL